MDGFYPAVECDRRRGFLYATWLQLQREHARTQHSQNTSAFFCRSNPDQVPPALIVAHEQNLLAQSDVVGGTPHATAAAAAAVVEPEVVIVLRFFCSAWAGRYFNQVWMCQAAVASKCRTRKHRKLRYTYFWLHRLTATIYILRARLRGQSLSPR